MTSIPRALVPLVSVRALVAVTVGLAAADARAQDTTGFNAHGFHLAPHDADLRDPLVVQRPGAFSQGDFFFGALAEYADAPLVLVRSPEGGGDDVETPVLDNVLALNLSGGVALHDHLRVDLKAPVYFLSTGLDPAAPGAGQGLTEGPAMGDVRASAMVLAVRPRHIVGSGGPGLGIVGYVDLPSGTPDRFLGQSAVAGGAKLAATYEWPVVTLSADVGTQFNPSLEGLDNLNGSDNLVASLGLGLLATDNVGFNFEVAAAPPFEPPERIAFPAEGLASMRVKDPSGAFWTLGAAAGLTSGPGVAAFRVFVGGGFGQAEPPRQPDFDPIGTLSATDTCPTEPETVNGYKDDDGCPDKLGALAVDVRFQGQPWEAAASIVGPDGPRDETITARGLQIDTVPGTEWSVSASADGCLFGEASARAAETGTALVVELEPKLDAHVLVEVVGPDDQPVPEATVTWTSPLTHCIPQGPSQVNASGMIEQDLAAGSHHVVVTAPGHSVFEQDVTFASGDDQVIQVRLDITRIRVEKKQIVILEKVHFETAKAVIKPESFGLLNEVADIVNTNPDLGRVEVAGHTDSRGSDSYNLKLSQDRAESVKTYLVGQGVPEDQLVAVGYGETKPIDTNKTDSGREANRRVEFNLIDRQDDEEAPADGEEQP